MGVFGNTGGVFPPQAGPAVIKLRALTDADFGALIVGSVGVYWSSLTFSGGEWTGTWAAGPGSGVGYRPSHRIFAPLSVVAPRWRNDGTQGITLEILVSSFTDTGSDVRFHAGLGDRGGASLGTEQGLAALLEDTTGGTTQLNGASSVSKAGGSTNYAGVPTRICAAWLPAGDPTAVDGLGGTLQADFFDGATRVHRSGPSHLATQWTGEIGVWFGASGLVGVGAGSQVVWSASIGVWDWLPQP